MERKGGKEPALPIKIVPAPLKLLIAINSKIVQQIACCHYSGKCRHGVANEIHRRFHTKDGRVGTEEVRL